MLSALRVTCNVQCHMAVDMADLLALVRDCHLGASCVHMCSIAPPTAKLMSVLSICGCTSCPAVDALAAVAMLCRSWQLA